ncbi:Vasopressin receptor [Mactra antiquata]
MIPWAVFYQQKIYRSPLQEFPYCNENWPDEADGKYFFLGAIFLCCYSVPLVLIVACYFLIGVRVWRRRAPGEKNTSLGVVQKSKVKTVKMLAIVVVSFAFSWLPLYVIRLINFYGVSPVIVNEVINPIAQWLGSSNSGMNPIIYCFFSKRYRNGFKDTITSCCNSESDVRLSRRSLASAMAAHSYMNGNAHKIRKAYQFQVVTSSDSTSDTCKNTYV